MGAVSAAAGAVTSVSQIEPGRAYGLAAVCAVLQRHPDTVRKWIKTGRIKTLPRVGLEQYRVSGAELLALFGLTHGVAPQPPSETHAQRQKRAAADAAEALRLAKRKPR